VVCLWQVAKLVVQRPWHGGEDAMIWEAQHDVRRQHVGVTLGFAVSGSPIGLDLG
jgi:hypothetical protein